MATGKDGKQQILKQGGSPMTKNEREQFKAEFITSDCQSIDGQSRKPASDKYRE